MICRALLNDPQLLVLDEPTSGLDLESVELIRSRILSFAEQGKAVFMSTHSLEEADELCNRVAFINHGKIIAEGDPASLKLRYGQDYVRVDLIPTVPLPEFWTFVEKLQLTKSDQDGRVISLVIPMTNEHLGSQLDKLLMVGRILRIHSQEASLREVFKAVFEGDLALTN